MRPPTSGRSRPSNGGARARVLLTVPYLHPLPERFAAVFERHTIDVVMPPIVECLSARELIPLVGDIDGAICVDDAYTEEVLAHAPRLRVISKWGTGIDSIDVKACQRRGIVVCNTPNAFTETVADTTMGYTLFLARQLHVLAADMRSGLWRKHLAPTLAECTVGLIGVGNIGRAVARRAAVFGCRIIGCDPVTPPAAIVEACRMEMVELPRLLAESDIISIHCTLNPTSLHLLNAETLKLIRPHAYVINTARGRVIQEAALVEALRRGQLAGAALDVFEQEPLPTESPLRSMPNVFLGPHNANSSPRAWETVHVRTIDNCIKRLRPPMTVAVPDATPA